MAAISEKQYYEAVGRRKTSVARVRIFPNTKASFVINDKELAEYFPTADLRRTATESLDKSGIQQKFKVTVKLSGGGISSQSEAVRHALARAVIVYDPNLRTTVKKEGFLKRDPRAKERRKFGLKKARKSPQWSKR
jgi:small subunit ribosomal protein S9